MPVCTSWVAKASASTASATGPIEDSYTGFSEQPRYSDAKKVADALISRFVTETDDGVVWTRSTWSTPSSSRR